MQDTKEAPRPQKPQTPSKPVTYEYKDWAAL